jgi:hypothetical protein
MITSNDGYNRRSKMGWARKMADKKKLNQVLVRCKNSKHDDKRTRALERDDRRQARDFRVANEG